MDNYVIMSTDTKNFLTTGEPTYWNFDLLDWVGLSEATIYSQEWVTHYLELSEFELPDGYLFIKLPPCNYVHIEE